MNATTKMSPCCARLRARVTMEEANLARVARRAAIRAQRGLSTAYLQSRIEDGKAAIAEAKAAVDNHDADHAGGGL